MPELRTAHTSALGADTLGAIQALLDLAFDGDVDEHDYEHALGGMHAMVWDGVELIGHAQ
jgi:aminoglycoside 2'-N-acetyltransferase I